MYFIYHYIKLMYKIQKEFNKKTYYITDKNYIKYIIIIFIKSIIIIVFMIINYEKRTQPYYFEFFNLKS